MFLYEIAPRKRMSILLDSLIPKKLHYNCNVLIHLLKACFTLHDTSEFCLFFVSLT